MAAIRRLIDNRVCLLGLDWMYREAMKRHEKGELLECARLRDAVLRPLQAAEFAGVRAMLVHAISEEAGCSMSETASGNRRWTP